MKRNPVAPAMPSGMVALDKGPMHDVVVGILGANRMPAFGFDVTGCAPNHWRMVNYGPFGVLVGTRHAVEVKVLLDGELLLNTKLYPFERPLPAGADPKMQALLAEAPQPHFLTHKINGQPFTFATHDASLSPSEIIAEQIHPGRFTSPPAIDHLDRGAAPSEEMKLDLSPDKLGLPPLPAVPARANEDKPEERAATAGGYAALDATDQKQPSASQEADAPEKAIGVADGDHPDSSKSAAADASPPPQAGVSTPVEPAPDLTKRSINWAPSHGLVAVGVRLLQQARENEPPTPPDAFTYVTFQLNPWSLHNLARCRLMGRVILPSREKMMEIMRQEGHLSDAPAVAHVVCGSPRCGHK